MIDATNFSDIEEKIAIQCAPVIVGIKIANLLVLNDCEGQYALQLFQDTKLILQALCTFETKTYYLLYQPRKLKEYIQQKPILDYLRELGYKKYSLDIIIRKIAYKYNKFMYEKASFPHEIGLLLGYPLIDVSSFIVQEGSGYLYSGYWKVYDNLSDTLIVFSRYRKAKEILLQLVLRGGNLSAVICEAIQYDNVKEEAVYS